MTDLTPETLAEWRKDTNRDRRSVIPMNVWLGRIIALLNALAEQQRIRVEITRTLINPANCKVWRDGVLVFDGVSLDALATEKAAREEAEREQAELRTAYDEMRPIWIKRCEDAEARADKAEQERDQHKRRAEVHIERELSSKARVAALEAGINALIEAACHHCGKQPEQDGDHTCDCPNTDSECLEHTLHPMGPRLNDLRALTEKGADDA